MTRPLRIEFDGALYHVTTRGDRRAAIFHDDLDRTYWLEILGQVCLRFEFSVYAFCQMGNHFHILLETRQGGLSKGMRQLNGVYSQTFNRRHSLVGHVFQGRYNALLCQKDAYLQELARYIVLNPVRAGLVATPEEWRWSSHRFVMGQAPCPAWLDTHSLLSHFGATNDVARDANRDFTLQGIGAKNPLEGLQHQFHLGALPALAFENIPAQTNASGEISRAHKSALQPALKDYFAGCANFDKAVVDAYLSRCFSMSDIAQHCGISRRSIGRILRAHQTSSLISQKPDS